jgi:serine/threonine-protein kinase
MALRIIDQVARVIELLQQPFQLSNGQTWQLVYQDLKPGNIIVDRNGRASVLDFGGCQVVIDGTLVLNGSHSPGYSAPECGPSEAGITRAADSYGLGTTLLHMLTGVNPRRLLPGDPAKTGQRAVRLNVAKLLEGICHASVIEFVAKAVAWEPESRHADASEFRRALLPLLN